MNEIEIAPFVAGSMRVSLNGLALKRGEVFDYTEESGATVKLNDSVLAGDRLVFEFIEQGS